MAKQYKLPRDSFRSLPPSFLCSVHRISSPSLRLVIIASAHSVFLAAMQSLQSPPLRASPLDPFRPKSATKAPSTTALRPLRRILPHIRAAVSAPKRENDPKKRVVITGMGLVSVFGSDVDAYYEKLLAGESGISLIDRFDASKFPTRFAGQIRGFTSMGYIDGKNDRRLDDCLRYCIVAGKRALEDADLGGDRLSKVKFLCKMDEFPTNKSVLVPGVTVD